MYKHMLARLVKNVWHRCAAEQKERDHRSALFKQSLDRTILHFRSDVAAHADLVHLSDNTSECEGSWPSPSLSSVSSTGSVSSDDFILSEHPSAGPPSAQNAPTTEGIQIICAELIKKNDDLWQPVLRYEVSLTSPYWSLSKC